MRLAAPRPNRSKRSRRVRAPLGVLIASMVLLASAIGPATAASPAKGASPWSKAPDRTVTKRHVASAKAAARRAVGSPRNAAAKQRPLLRATKGAAKPGSPAALKASTTSSVRPQLVAGPVLQIAEQFAGLNEMEAGGWVPPDPWVSVNSIYVVQTVNSGLRISNRLGTEITSIPIWAFFALPFDQVPTDPRVIWDAVHGRWVGILASFNGDDSLDLLNLAVSDSADPTAGWSVYAIPFVNEFPDYPSVSSSSDKIVMTANMFDSGFLGSDIITVTWASILAGGLPTGHVCSSPNYFAPRAAQVLSPGSDVHIIAELADITGEQWYFRVKGTGLCAEIVDGTDLGSAFAAPPNPRQSGGAFGDFTIDERPTDAIWQNGKLWWVSTVPVTYDGDLTFNDGVALWNATTATIGSPTPGAPYVINAGDGIDNWMGGIGLTRNGTLVTIYSQSSDTAFVSMESNQVDPGGLLAAPIHLDDGDAHYPVDRWGDFAGVAMDPVGTGAVWATHEVSDVDGNWRTQVVRLVADDESPTNPGIPTSKVLVPANLSANSVPVRISWTPATDARSGTVTYQMAESIDSGGFYEISTLSTTSIVRQQLIGHTYDYLIGAIDAVGNESGGVFSPSLTPYLYQQTSSTTYSGTWSSSTNANYSGSSVKYASAAGKTATFTASSARSIAFVTAKGPSRGSFKVYVDGVLKATVSAYSSTTKYRQIVYQFNWATPGTHKIKIYVKGTSGHPRVDIDAWVVLR